MVSVTAANVLTAVDTRRALINKYPHGDLKTPVLAGTQPFAPRFLFSEVRVQTAALGFVSGNAQVDRQLADNKESGNLPTARATANKELNALPQNRGDLFGIEAITHSLSRFTASLFGSIPHNEAKSTLDLRVLWCCPNRLKFPTVMFWAITKLSPLYRSSAGVHIH